MKDRREYTLHIRLNKEEKEIITKLKELGIKDISKYIRKDLRTTYEVMLKNKKSL